MNSFILFVLLVSLFYSSNHIADCNQHNQNKYPAFKYYLLPKDIYFDGTKNVSCFIACPASTKKQTEFNNRLSITRNSLFLLNVHGPEENITLNICDKPVEPTMLYNLKNKLYEIGYEIYFERDKLKWDDGANQTHIYRRVNITNNNEVIDNDTSINMKLILNNDSSKLVFHWVSVLSVFSLREKKQTQLFYFDERQTMIVDDDAVQCKCDHYLRQINLKVYISSEGDNNLKKSKNTSPDGEKLTPCNTQSYGSLELSQLIPLWYFRESWAKAASCSHMNMIPVWKSIADGQLRKVDLYIQAIIRKVGYCKTTSVLFGADGILTLRNGNGINSDQQQEMYILQDKGQGRQIIPIPKILYRVVEVICKSIKYEAVIVIHNDPNVIQDGDRICPRREEIYDWDEIKNDDPRTGLTYVCEFKKFMQSMSLQKVPRLHIPITWVDENLRLNDLLGEYNCLSPLESFYNAKPGINQEYERLLNITAPAPV